MENKLSFYARVYEIVKLVPAGRITTYGHIAKYLGSAASANTATTATHGIHRRWRCMAAHKTPLHANSSFGRIRSSPPNPGASERETPTRARREKNKRGVRGDLYPHSTCIAVAVPITLFLARMLLVAV